MRMKFAVLVARSLRSSSFNHCKNSSTRALSGSRGSPTEATFGARSPFKWTGRPAAIVGMDGRQLPGPVKAALTCIVVLLCLNIHTFWLHVLRPLPLTLRRESVVLRVCDIPAYAGWFFRGELPNLEREISEFGPALFLLPPALYGFCALRSSTHWSDSDVRLRPTSKATLTRPAGVVLLLRERCEEGTECLPVSNECVIHTLSDIPLARDRRQYRAGVESCQSVRVVLLLTLLTSVATLLRGATELVAALSHTSAGLQLSKESGFLCCSSAKQ